MGTLAQRGRVSLQRLLTVLGQLQCCGEPLAFCTTLLQRLTQAAQLQIAGMLLGAQAFQIPLNLREFFLFGC